MRDDKPETKSAPAWKPEKDENPVPGKTARELLGQPGPPINKMRYAALMHACGTKGHHYVYVSKLRHFLRNHPNWKMSDTWPPAIKALAALNKRRLNLKKSRPSIPQGPRHATEHTNGVQS